MNYDDWKFREDVDLILEQKYEHFADMQEKEIKLAYRERFGDNQSEIEQMIAELARDAYWEEEPC